MSNSFTSVFGAGGGGGTDATKLPLTGGTLTGALINSTNGAASTPVVSLTGTTFTGGTATTTKPTLLVEPTGTTSTGWSTSGTLIGANAATGFTGRLIDCQIAGSTKFFVDLNGSVNIASGGVVISSGVILTYNGTTFLGSSTSGNVNLNPGGTSWFQFGTAGNLSANSASQIGWSSGSVGTNDTILGRAAAATLQLGTPLASSWVSQTFAAAGGRIGTDTNNSPTNTLTIAGSVSTGTGTGGNLRLGVYGTNGSSGSAIGTLNTVLTVVAARKVINIAGIPTSSAGLSSGDVYSNAGILTIVA